MSENVLIFDYIKHLWGFYIYLKVGVEMGFKKTSIFQFLNNIQILLNIERFTNSTKFTDRTSNQYSSDLSLETSRNIAIWQL